MINSLRTNAIWNTVGSIIGLGCQWLITLLVVRLSPTLDDAGYLNLAISITSIFGAMASFNLRTYIISDRDGEVSGELYSGFRLATCLCSFLACMLYSSLFGYSFTQYLCILFYMIFRVEEAILDLFYAFEQKAGRMDIGGRSMSIRGFLSLTGFVITFILTQSLALSLLVMVSLTLVVIILYDYPEAKAFGSFKPAVNRKFAILFRDGLLITIASFFSDWITVFPRQAIEETLGIAAVGAYTTVAAPLTILQVGVSFVFNPLLPLFDAYYAKVDQSEYSRLFLKTMLVILVLIVASSLLVLFFGERVLAFLYGNAVAEYSFLLPSLLLIISINAIQWFLRILLVMMRVFIPQIIGVLIAFAVCFLTATPFIEQYGLMGANYCIIICYALSCFITFSAFLFACKKHFSTNVDDNHD